MTDGSLDGIPIEQFSSPVLNPPPPLIQQSLVSRGNRYVFKTIAEIYPQSFHDLQFLLIGNC